MTVFFQATALRPQGPLRATASDVMPTRIRVQYHRATLGTVARGPPAVLRGGQGAQSPGGIMVTIPAHTRKIALSTVGPTATACRLI